MAIVSNGIAINFKEYSRKDVLSLSERRALKSINKIHKAQILADQLESERNVLNKLSVEEQAALDVKRLLVKSSRKAIGEIILMERYITDELKYKRVWEASDRKCKANRERKRLVTRNSHGLSEQCRHIIWNKCNMTSRCLASLLLLRSLDIQIRLGFVCNVRVYGGVVKNYDKICAYLIYEMMRERGIVIGATFETVIIEVNGLLDEIDGFFEATTPTLPSLFINTV